ncbi:MAG TPA: DUF58 domain-containing protein [Candidatus Limnocylindrales bacterium]|nr:DUF58 domain-containing protein [Candidatus Limnocylindrales bacterium]
MPQMPQMSGWTSTAVLIMIFGVGTASPPIVFIGGALLVIRLLADRWPRRVLDALVYERSVSPSSTVVGDEVNVRLSLWNKSRLPIAWAGSDDTISQHLQARPAAAELSTAGPMRPFERVTRRVTVVPMRRGVHEVGPVRVRVAEHFGTHSPYVDVPDQPAIILARPLMVPIIGSSPQSAPLAQVRARRSLYVDPTLFAGVRPYQAGDSMRTIHWRASAREGKLQSKRFEPALSRQQILVLDVQTVEGAFWMLNYDEDLFEDLCIAALSLARANVVADAATGFAAAGFTRTTQRIAYLPPRADREQIERIGDLLARITTESSAPLGELLAWLPRRVARGTTIVILSGRNPISSAGVVKRLEASGFPVHFVLFRATEQMLRDGRRAGMSCTSAVVETEGRRPRAVVMNAEAA